MKVYKIVAINLGSTSTKFAYYENDQCILKDNIIHPAEDLKQFSSIREQFDYRYDAITEYIESKGLSLQDLDAIVTRGGHTHPITGGTYRITEKMLEESRSGVYGQHATDLGLEIAFNIGKTGPAAFTVDPPTTDEFEPLARYSGLPEMPRRSSFHALNHRAAARQYAKDAGKKYEDLNLIVVHMGGGITVAAHKKGKMVDANNGLEGEGPFSTNRTGTLPVGALTELCFSGTLTLKEVKHKLNGIGGLMAYVGENDVLTIERKATAGSEPHMEALHAMCYQTAKEIASLSAVLYGQVDAIIMTGGIAHSKLITGLITERVSFIAPVHLYPGEFEMQSLGLNAYGALTGSVEIKELM